ncbi:MAG: putative 2OG-Fe(II) oxygenase [Pseudomonadota bacterium]
MQIPSAIDAPLVEQLIALANSESNATNSRSKALSHSKVQSPAEHPATAEVERTLHPKLVEFGRLLFGEALRWSTKEMWLNRLETGGYQTVHSHANSFISGIVYLTASHPSANTVFYRSMGGREFAFTNQHSDAKMGPYNAPRWAVPNKRPGDVVLFPSYLLHEVPRNEGPARMTLAFNSIPERLRSWDYELHFS